MNASLSVNLVLCTQTMKLKILFFNTERFLVFGIVFIIWTVFSDWVNIPNIKKVVKQSRNSIFMHYMCSLLHAELAL